TLSIGVASYPEDGTCRQSLIAAADSALYAAKRRGRNCVMCFSKTVASGIAPVDQEAHDKRQALERSMERAAFSFVYQPICDAEDGRVFGYEALCRPLDPELGNVLDALRTAEDAGKMMQLGRIL